MQPEGSRIHGQRLSASQRPIYVHKVSRHTNVTIVPNEAAQDACLSWGARGLLTYMLSMPTDWELNEADLVTRSPGGRDQLRTLLKELEAAGHLLRSRRRDASGRVVGSDWEVWDQPQTGKPATEKPSEARTQSGRGPSPRTEKPSPENPSMAEELRTEKPSPENPSEAEPQPETAISPRTDNPAAAIEPLTAFPSPENPSIYKENTQQKQQEPKPEEPPIAPPEGGPPEPQPGAVAVEAAAEPPSQSRRRKAKAAESFPLPDYAEPFRPLVVAWWRARCAKHPRSEGEGLTTLSLSGLAYAHKRGVLEQFLEHAAAAGWLSLGFNGHRRFIETLISDLAVTPCHSESGMVRFGDQQPRPLTRQAEAVNRAAALIEAMTP
jgi:hypothetical protein